MNILQKLTPSKKITLLTVAVLILIGLLSFAVIRSEQSRAVRHQEAVQRQAQEQAERNITNKRISDLEASLKTSETKRAAVCNHVTGLSKAPNTRYTVTVPVLACS